MMHCRRLDNISTDEMSSQLLRFPLLWAMQPFSSILSPLFTPFYRTLCLSVYSDLSPSDGPPLTKHSSGPCLIDLHVGLLLAYLCVAMDH
jgi:hypothetical protein